MATTVHEPPKIEPSRSPNEGSGNGGWRNVVPADGDARKVADYSPPPASTGIWVVLAAITMSFAAFTSALIVRQASALDWRHFSLPSVLYWNTLVILASSVTLEISRRQVATYLCDLRSQAARPARRLYETLPLRRAFLAGHTSACRQFIPQGISPPAHNIFRL